MANELSLLVTLTFDADHKVETFKEAHQQCGRFVQRIRRSVGVPLPALGVPERHRSGCYHLHLALPAWIPDDTVRRAWRLGTVDVARKTVDQAVLYVIKELKDPSRDAPTTYFRSRGFAPVIDVSDFETLPEALSEYSDLRMRWGKPSHTRTWADCVGRPGTAILWSSFRQPHDQEPEQPSLLRVHRQGGT